MRTVFLEVAIRNFSKFNRGFIGFVAACFKMTSLLIYCMLLDSFII